MSRLTRNKKQEMSVLPTRYLKRISLIQNTPQVHPCKLGVGIHASGGFESKIFFSSKWLCNGLKHCFLTIGLLFLVACAGDSDDDAANDFPFSRMFANYGENIIQPLYAEFSEKNTDRVNRDIAAYCDAIDTDQEAAALQSAQSAWRSAMSTWQRAELFIVGPAAENNNSLRNAIFSYASNFPPSTCAVDQSVVLAQSDDFNINARAFNSRGLDALEYLLFNDTLTHTCPSQITETRTWDALPEVERKQQRCDYALDVVQDIQSSVDTLSQRWSVDGDNYQTFYSNPVNNQTALSDLSDALFYIELETKDTKLGLPTGIHEDCPQQACPLAVESPYSETSLVNIRENLEGFRLAITGGEGLGFDDIITSAGFAEVVTEFNQNIDAAIALIDEINRGDTSLLDQSQALLASDNRDACDASAENPDTNQSVPMCSLHGLLKRITDSLRIDFIAIVNLNLPDRGQSDND